MDPPSYGRASGSMSQPPERSHPQAGSASVLLDNWHFIAALPSHSAPSPTGADYGHGTTFSHTAPSSSSASTSAALLSGTGFHSQRPGWAQPTVSFVTPSASYDRPPPFSRTVPFAETYNGDPMHDYHANIQGTQPQPPFPVAPSNDAGPHHIRDEYAMSTETSLDHAMNFDFTMPLTQDQVGVYQRHGVASTSNNATNLPGAPMPTPGTMPIMAGSNLTFEDDVSEDESEESDQGEPPAQRRRLNNTDPNHPATQVVVAHTSSHQHPHPPAQAQVSERPSSPLAQYFAASDLPVPHRLVVCLAQAAVPCLGQGILVGMGVTPLDSDVASEVSAVMPTRRTRAEVMQFSGIIKMICNDVRLLPEDEKGPAVQRVLNNMFLHKIGKEVSGIIYQKVTSFLKIMTAFVVDLICNKDIFGLQKWDNVYCLPTFLAEIGRMATSMSHSHWFLLHANLKGLKITDVEMHSMTSTRPGSAVLPGVISVASPIAYRIACKFSMTKAKKVTMDAAARARKNAVKVSRPPRKAGAATQPATDATTTPQNADDPPDVTVTTDKDSGEDPSASHMNPLPNASASSSTRPAQPNESSSSNSNDAEPHPPSPSFPVDSSNAAPTTGASADPDGVHGGPARGEGAGKGGGAEEKGTEKATEEKAAEEKAAEEKAAEEKATEEKVAEEKAAEEKAAEEKAAEEEGTEEEGTEGKGTKEKGTKGKGTKGKGTKGKGAEEKGAEGKGAKGKGTEEKGGEAGDDAQGDGKDDPRQERSGARKHVGDRLLRTNFGELKAVILNFNGEALTQTTEHQLHILNQMFVDVDSGKSVVKAFYDHQAEVEAIGGAEDHTWRTEIIPQAIICSVLQYVYDQKTLRVDPDNISTHALAQEVMRSKLVTATENMGQWVTDEPEEHLILRNRVMGMMESICDSSELDHESLIDDLKQTFRPSVSDHLQVAGQSFTERYRPRAVRYDSSDRDLKFTRDLLVRLLPPRD